MRADPAADHYEPAPNVDPTINDIARRARVNANWLESIMEPDALDAADTASIRRAARKAVAAYDGADDDWDDLFIARLRTYFGVVAE